MSEIKSNESVPGHNAVKHQHKPVGGVDPVTDCWTCACGLPLTVGIARLNSEGQNVYGFVEATPELLAALAEIAKRNERAP